MLQTKKTIPRGFHTFKSHSLFTRFFASYISILLIVVLVIGSAYYYLQTNIISKETQSGEDFLSYVYTIVDEQLRYIIERMNFFFQNPETSLSLASITEPGASTRTILNALSNIISSSPIIDACFLYNSGLPSVLSNGGTLPSEIFLDYLSGCYGGSAGEMAQILSDEKPLQILSNRLSDADSARVQAKLSYIVIPGNKMALIMGGARKGNANRLIVLISEREIRETLLQANIINYATAYVLDGKGHIISSSQSPADAAANGETAFDPALFSIISGGEQEQTFRNNDNLILYRHSAALGGYYVVILPYAAILANLNIIRNALVASLIILSGICTLFAIHYSRLFYNPVSRLVEKLGAQQSLDGPSLAYKDEFALIDHWTDHIQLSYHKSQETQTLMRMLESGIKDEDATKYFPYKAFLASALLSTTPYLDALYTYIAETPMEQAILKLVKINNEYACLLFNGDSLDMQQIKAYFSALKNTLEPRHGFFLVVGLGNICDTPQQVNHSFKNALDAIRLSISEDETCLFEHIKSQKAAHKLYFPPDFSEKITDALMAGSEDLITSIISAVLSRNKGLPRVYMRMIYNEFLNTYIRLCEKHGQDALTLEAVSTIENEYRPSLITTYLIGLFTSLIPAISVPQDTAQRVVAFIYEYIEKNYQNENVNIEDIAEKLDLSYSYVSMLFKRNTGINLSQYLIEYRIGKAKELLLGSDYPIKDIASRVGYLTYNSFIRTFRKIVGMPPSQYRQMNTQGK